MTIISFNPNSERAYRLADWSKSTLDCPDTMYDRQITKYYYKKFLENKKDCPTLAKVALQEIYNKDNIYYPKYYEKHKTFLERDIDVDILVKTINRREQTNYPKTNSIRNLLIENNRIKLGYVKKKAKGIEKLLLKLKVMF